MANLRKEVLAISPDDRVDTFNQPDVELPNLPTELKDLPNIFRLNIVPPTENDADEEVSPLSPPPSTENLDELYESLIQDSLANPSVETSPVINFEDESKPTLTLPVDENENAKGDPISDIHTIPYKLDFIRKQFKRY